MLAVAGPGVPRNRLSENRLEIAMLQEVRATGREALTLATALLQRARLADPQEGPWEAADVQWRWARPRASDDSDSLFWLDDEGPVAGVLLTSAHATRGLSNGSWQCDPVLVPGANVIEPSALLRRAIDHASEQSGGQFEVPLNDDGTGMALTSSYGMKVLRHDSTGWMSAADAPEPMTLTTGFVIVDRTQRRDAPHPMQRRNGDAVEQRLQQCPLYDPWLDLAVETDDGRSAGYSLYWHDPVTGVGLIEPVRVEDEFQRLGLARAMLSHGLARLVTRGATRLKVSWESDAAGALYTGLGFRHTDTTTWYRYGPA